MSSASQWYENVLCEMADDITRHKPLILDHLLRPRQQLSINKVAINDDGPKMMPMEVDQQQMGTPSRRNGDLGD